MVEKPLDVVFAARREHAVDLVVAENRGDAQRRLAVAVRDARVGAGRKQPLHLARVAADDRGMEQRIAERALHIGIADAMCHAMRVPFARDGSVAFCGYHRYR